MPDQSFFQLTTPHAPAPAEPVLADLTPEAFDALHAEAEPLADVLFEAIDAYAQAHGLSMLAAWMAADIVRFCLGREIQATGADA